MTTPPEVVNIFAIDPSINQVGWAKVEGLRRDEDGVWNDELATWTYGYWDIGSHALPYKLEEIVDWCKLDVHCDRDWWFVGEWPTYFGTIKGQISAMQGNTINLGAVIAYIAGYFQILPQNVHLLTATQWKGSVPKEITKMRFFKVLGVKQGQIKTINHNAIDAIMLLHEFCRRRRISFRMIRVCDPAEDA